MKKEKLLQLLPLWIFFFVHYYIIVAALSTFPNLSNQSDTSEIYYNRKEDIAEYYVIKQY